jgi:hypothetical protein
MNGGPWVIRAVRWWFGFWFGPGGRATTVWLVWAGMTAALLGFIQRYGQNIPSWEEWVFLPGLLGERDRLNWMFERLQEHRYPLGRAVFLGLFELSGHDFRAGMYASAVALSAAAALLLRAVAALRGRIDYPDILIPALVLSVGGSENLFLGYQIQFTLDALLAAALVRSATSPSPGGRRLFTDGVLITLLALGGWVGLAFVPAGVVWIAWRTWSWYRQKRSAIRAAGVLVLPATAAAYFVWCYLDVRRHPLPGATLNLPAETAKVWVQFLANSCGTFGPDWMPWSGVAGVGLLLLVVVVLGRDLLFRPDRRSTAAGWLVVVSAVVLMGYGLANRRPNGYAVRNLPFIALVPIIAHLLAVRSAGRFPVWVRAVGTAVVVCVVSYIYWHGWRTGVGSASFFWERNRQYERDRAAGLPLNFLASRHQQFPLPEFRDSLRLLRDTGHPSARGIPDPLAMRAEPLVIPSPSHDPIPNDPVPVAANERPPVWRFDLGADRSITGVRVRFEYPKSTTRVPMHVVWERPDGTTGAALCQPWLIPFGWEFDFWVNDRVRTLWFRPVHQSDEMTLLGAQLLLPADR